MTLDDLMTEAKLLAKPSLLLDEQPSETGVVAVWGGSGFKEGYGGRDGYTHRITIDCEWLANQGIRIQGSLGVYDVDPKWRRPVPIQVDPQRTKSLEQLKLSDGVPLYGHEALSLPPIEALCLYGGRVVERWLRSLGLDHTDYDQLAGTELGELYNNEYQKQSPLFSDEYAAVLGGWHAIWPDDDFYIPREMRLVLWTLRDAEPWIEVFERAPNYPIRVRTT
jgi:hypothetical protein